MSFGIFSSAAAVLSDYFSPIREHKQKQERGHNDQLKSCDVHQRGPETAYGREPNPRFAEDGF